MLIRSFFLSFHCSNFYFYSFCIIQANLSRKYTKNCNLSAAKVSNAFFELDSPVLQYNNQALKNFKLLFNCKFVIFFRKFLNFEIFSNKIVQVLFQEWVDANFTAKSYQ